MNNDQSWNPGHGPVGGYPHEAVMSEVVFGNRPTLFLNEENKVVIDLPERQQIENSNEILLEYVMSRCLDFQNALNVAEDQIRDILRENPFSPEKMGFKLEVSPSQVTDVPIRLYVHSENKNYSLFRTPNANPITMYTLLKKKEDNTFMEMQLNLPCERIAYAALFAIGVPVTKAKTIGQTDIEERAEESIRSGLPSLLQESEPVVFAPNTKPYQLTSHLVQFKRHGETKSVPVNANDNKDAMSKAKFLLETDIDAPYTDVKFEEMEVIDYPGRKK